MKTQLTLKEYIRKHGEEKTAYKLVDNRVKRILGLSISDIPDTCEIADIVQELADQLTDDPADKKSIRAILQSIDIDLIERVILG